MYNHLRLPDTSGKSPVVISMGNVLCTKFPSRRFRSRIARDSDIRGPVNWGLTRSNSCFWNFFVVLRKILDFVLKKWFNFQLVWNFNERIFKFCVRDFLKISEVLGNEKMMALWNLQSHASSNCLGDESVENKSYVFRLAGWVQTVEPGFPFSLVLSPPLHVHVRSSSVLELPLQLVLLPVE